MKVAASTCRVEGRVFRHCAWRGTLGLPVKGERGTSHIKFRLWPVLTTTKAASLSSARTPQPRCHRATAQRPLPG